jgi:hypothetical protein
MSIETYSESAEGVMIGRDRAAVECRRHGMCEEDTIELVREVFGDSFLVDASLVLQALGY